MRSVNIVPDEVYHIYNRGNQKQTLFYTERNYIRMLLSYFDVSVAKTLS